MSSELLKDCLYYLEDCKDLGISGLTEIIEKLNKELEKPEFDADAYLTIDSTGKPHVHIGKMSDSTMKDWNITYQYKLYKSPPKAIKTGKKLFQFESEQDWINKAQRIWKLNEITADKTICVDKLGRICSFGLHFRLAKEDNAYPIEVFLLRD